MQRHNSPVGGMGMSTVGSSNPGFGEWRWRYIKYKVQKMSMAIKQWLWCSTLSSTRQCNILNSKVPMKKEKQSKKMDWELHGRGFILDSIIDQNSLPISLSTPIVINTCSIHNNSNTNEAFINIIIFFYYQYCILLCVMLRLCIFVLSYSFLHSFSLKKFGTNLMFYKQV